MICKFKLFQEDLITECSDKEWDDITMKLYNTTRIHWVWHNGYIHSIKDDGINFSIKMCDSPDYINMNDYIIIYIDKTFIPIIIPSISISFIIA